MTTIGDLPDDLLSITLLFLDPQSFLAFSRTCKGFYQYRQDSLYWRTVTSSTFRLPISPLLKADGARWYWLYKRLRTQTKLYTWGQGLKGNLGPGRSPQLMRTLRGRMRPPVLRRVPPSSVISYQRTSSTWPTEVHVPSEVGVIADLQCGGWSTSILSSRGEIYTVGMIDSRDGRLVGVGADEFTRLEYLTQSTTAIQHFSSGRRHILALTDEGDILSWDRINAKGLKIFSQQGHKLGTKDARVVAGWAESSAYVPATGIMYWTPIRNDQDDDMLDSLSVEEKVVPYTARYVTKENVTVEPVAYVVLESWIVWLTSDGKLFAYDLQPHDRARTEPTFSPFEVPGYASSTRTLKDIQGQYNKFAVFTDSDEVLAGDTDYLIRCAEKVRSHASLDPGLVFVSAEWPGMDRLVSLRPPDSPVLQHNHVISLAFGDHHYHALHVNGKITSYGQDSQSRGALGLGDMPSGARFRGLVTPQRFQADSRLLPQAESRGRAIWFEPEKRDWLKYMEETVKSGRLPMVVDAEGHQRTVEETLAPNTQRQFMFSEWVEQEGRHWQDGPLSQVNPSIASQQAMLQTHDFLLDPYFAMAVSAAGWHSGALVLVDEEESDAVRQKWITKMPSSTDDPDRPPIMPGHFESGPDEPEEVYVWKVEGFPKIILPDRFEMPGDGETRPWRDGMPKMADLGLGPVD